MSVYRDGDYYFYINNNQNSLMLVSHSKYLNKIELFISRSEVQRCSSWIQNKTNQYKKEIIKILRCIININTNPMIWEHEQQAKNICLCQNAGTKNAMNKDIYVD